MSVFDNDYSWIVHKRKGDSTDPYSPITEQITVINGKAILRELPNKFNGITISDLTKTFFVKYQGVPDTNNVVIDLNGGYAYFDAQYNNKQYTATYSGEGVYHLSAKRVWTQVDQNNDVAQTVEDFVSSVGADLTHKGVWDSTKTYVVRNIVFYNNASYMCIKACTGITPTDTNYWQFLMGHFNHLGSFDSTKIYKPMDAVEYVGSSYMCVKTTTVGIIPTNTTYWVLLASGVSVAMQRSTINIASDTRNVPIGIQTFNSQRDTLMVFQNMAYIEQGIDYNIAADGTSIDRIDTQNWKTGTQFNFVSLKNITNNVNGTDASLLQLDGITDSKLSPDIKVGSLATLKTVNKSSITGAINENFDQIGNLSDKLGNVVSCKSLKMVPNDTTEANNNYSKITNAIQSGNTVLVDDRYYIKNISSENVPYINGLMLLGISANAELVVPETSWLWKPQNGSTIENIVIRDLKVTCTATGQNSGVRILLTDTTDIWYIKNFEVRNCTFEGRVVVIRSYAPKINPTTTTFGFNKVKIMYNTFSDSNFEYGTIGLTDYPHEEIYVEGNHTFNQDGVWLSVGLSNNHPYLNEMNNSMKKCIFKGNYLVNDDTFWNSGLSDYNCILLYEGLYAEYEGNHVEGIKMETIEMVMYDAYLNATTVISKNNYYKNNIHANPGSNKPSLIKSKQAVTANIDRLIDGNTYIIDETWVTARLAEKGYSISKISHDFFSLVQKAKSYVIRNCYVDVYYLNMNGGNVPFGNLAIENNTIIAKYISGSLALAKVETGFSDRFTIRNNEIVEKAKPTTDAYGVAGNPGSIALLYLDASTPQSIPNITIERNKITAYNSYEPLRVLTAWTVTVDYMECCDNECIYPDLSYSGRVGRFLTSESLTIKKLLMEGNRYTYDYVGTPILHNGLAFLPFIETNVKLRSTVKMQASNSGIFGLNGDIQLAKTYHILYRMKIFFDGGYEEFYFTLKYYYDPTSGRNAIDFIDTTGAAKKLLIPKSTDTSTSYIDPNDNVAIKLNPITTTIQGHTFKLRSNSTIVKFAYLSWTPSGIGTDYSKKWTYELEIVTSVVD